MQQGYSQAAGLDALLGKGFGNQLGQSQDAANAQAQDLLRLSGGQAQLPGVQQAIGGVPVQNALGFLHGGLPTQGLNQAGAAFGAAARMLPAEFAGTGQEQVASVLAKAALADQGFGQKRADLAAQLPGLILKNEDTLATWQATEDYRNATLAQKQAAQDFLNWYRGATVKQRQEQIGQKTQEFQQRLQETKRHNQATEKIQQQREAAAQKKAAAAIKKAKTPGMTPGERLTLLNRANKMAEDFYFGVPATTTTPAVAAILYPQALARLIALGMRRPDAIRLLNAYYAPGEGGRPVTGVYADVNPATNPNAAGPPAP